MLAQMGKCLGYDFDPVAIRKGAYAPKGHADIEIEFQLIRSMLVELLAGTRSLHVATVPDGEDATKNAERLRKAVFGVLEGRKHVQVHVTRDDLNQTNPSAPGPGDK